MLGAIISRAFGCFAAYPFPQKMQNFINKAYATYFKIDFSEHEAVDSYPSLQALFTRELKSARVLQDGFISPSDGLVLYSGKGQENQAFSIKHHSYDVKELLGETCKNGDLQDGFSYTGIYLSPRDYHHFHAPCDCNLESIEYQDGSFFSVSPRFLKIIDNLYVKNERVILRCKLPNQKLFWLVFVGALNVGKIRIDKEPRVQTNINFSGMLYNYQNENYTKGEHIGCFELGSSIVIIAQNDTLSFLVKQGDKIKFSQKIAEFI